MGGQRIDNVVLCRGVTLEANGNILVTGRENEHFRLSRWSPDGIRTKTYDRDIELRLVSNSGTTMI